MTCLAGLLSLFALSFCSTVQMKIEKLNFERMELGEGPHWDVNSQCLFCVDIQGHKIYKHTPSTNESISTGTGDGPVGFIVPVKDKPDHFIIGEKMNITLIHWNTKANIIVSKEVLATIPETLENRINDGKCDSTGRLWLGTITDAAVIKPNAASFYSYTKSGGLKKHVDKVTISNGIAITANNEKFYYIDSPKKTVDEYDFNIAGGDISFVKSAFKFPENDVPGVPDGMTIDTDGNLWVASFGGGQVVKVNPSTGAVLDSVKFPNAPQITSVNFGGPNLDDLYVTSANFYTDPVEKTKHSESGSVFKVSGLGSRGFPAVSFNLDL